MLLVMCQHHVYLPFSKSGWIGVDLFFVLSGFLISGLLFPELRLKRHISVGRFYVRRGLKIYPAFYVFLIAVAVFFPFVRPYLPVQAVFLQSYFFPPTLPRIVIGHLWSLAVEEHFYIALPLTLALLLKLNRLSWVPGIGLTLVILCALMRVPYCRIHGLEACPTHLRIDALWAGVVLRYWYHYRPAIFGGLSRWWSPWLGAVFLLLVVGKWLWAPLTMTANLLGFSLILAFAFTRTFRYVGWLAATGKYSYSIYLWHMPLAAVWDLGPSGFVGFAGYILTGLGVGIAMAEIVEMPVLAVRDRFFPSVLKTLAPGITEEKIPDPLVDAHSA